MTTPTVQFSHESRYTVINRPRAWRVAATTIALYLIASLCLQHDSSPLRHLIGLALLVMVTQLASPRLVQQVSLSLRGVTPSDTPRPVEMTPDNWTRVVAQIHRAAAAAVRNCHVQGLTGYSGHGPGGRHARRIHLQALMAAETFWFGCHGVSPRSIMSSSTWRSRSVSMARQKPSYW